MAYPVLVERIVTLNGAILVQFGQLVIWSNGTRIECGVIDGGNTIRFASAREKLRVQIRHKNKLYQQRQKALK